VVLSRVVKAATGRGTTGCRTVLGTHVEVVVAETRAGDLERIEHEDIDARRTVNLPKVWSHTAAAIMNANGRIGAFRMTTLILRPTLRFFPRLGYEATTHNRMQWYCKITNPSN
jgi:hypothetical protein